MFLWRIALIICCLWAAVFNTTFGSTVLKASANTNDFAEPNILKLDSQKIENASFHGTHRYIISDSLRELSIHGVVSRDFQTYKEFAASGEDITPYTTYWTKVYVQNVLENTSQWVLTLSPYNSIIEMYVRQPDGTFQMKRTGELIPVAEREFPKFKGAAFSLDIPYGQTREIYFKIERYNNFNPRMDLNFETMAHWESVTNDDNRLISLGFMQGALWLMAAFFLFYYFASGSPVYLYYSIFQVFQALSFLFEGYPYPIYRLLGDHTYLILHVWVFVNLLYVFFTAFVRSFINAPKLIPSWDFLFVVMMSVRVVCALIALVILTFWYDFKMADLVYGVYLVPFELISWSILIPIIFKKGDKIIRIFITGVATYIFSAMGLAYIVVNTNLDDDWAVYLHTTGFLLQFMFFAFVLGYRFIMVLNERKSAQQRYIEQLHKNQQMQQLINQDLENKVRERTVKINLQNQALLQKSQRLKELDQLKSRFLANISHEFRTPLTLMHGSLQRLHIRSTDSVARLEYEKIMGHGRSLLELINQLLELSHQKETKIALNIARIDVVDFVRTIVRSFDTYAEIQKVYYQYKLPRHAVMAECDPDKLRRIVENLLSNAFKFTASGGEVMVRLSRSKDHHTYTIDVRDTGVGIPEDKVDLIFDRFYRVEQENTYIQNGTGIGLSLVKEYVQMMGGKISVSSTEGKGSCFSVQLPIEQTDSLQPDFMSVGEVKQQENHIFPDGSELVVSKENRHKLPEILIVEDHTEVRNFLKETLQPYYFIIEARHGGEGLTLAKSYIPDLVITDLMMPGMNGLEFCEKIKSEELTSHIPVIMLTAKGSHDSRMEGWNTGADDYITKPFNLLELQARVKSILHNRQQLQDKFIQKVLEKPTDVAKEPEQDLFLKKLGSVLEKNYQRTDFQINDLTREMNMSRSPFYRKLKSLTGESPNTVIKKFRLKRAAQLLAEGRGTIAEVAEMVGFNSDSYFTKCFVEEYGHRPSEHRFILRKIRNDP